mmetsp:Transcript_49669/g.118301  ORF Transcript_49669/g.118301 Transcript_49669/m.118301 type:complete len:264 (+) Transcript_49669:1289-2080(+)
MPNWFKPPSNSVMETLPLPEASSALKACLGPPAACNKAARTTSRRRAADGSSGMYTGYRGAGRTIDPLGRAWPVTVRCSSGCTSVAAWCSSEAGSSMPPPSCEVLEANWAVFPNGDSSQDGISLTVCLHVPSVPLASSSGSPGTILMLIEVWVPKRIGAEADGARPRALDIARSSTASGMYAVPSATLASMSKLSASFVKAFMSTGLQSATGNVHELFEVGLVGGGSQLRRIALSFELSSACSFVSLCSMAAALALLSSNCSR